MLDVRMDAGLTVIKLRRNVAVAYQGSMGTTVSNSVLIIAWTKRAIKAMDTVFMAAQKVTMEKYAMKHVLRIVSWKFVTKQLDIV